MKFEECFITPVVFLSSHKRTLKPNNNLCYNFFISCLSFSLRRHLGSSQIYILRHWQRKFNVPSREPQNISHVKYDRFVRHQYYANSELIKAFIFIVSMLRVEGFQFVFPSSNMADKMNYQFLAYVL